MQRRRNLILAAAAVVSLGLSACSDDDDATIDSLVDDVESAARTAITQAENVARTAITQAEDVARSAITQAGEAVDDATAAAAETAVRNLAAEQGEQEFADNGHPINDDGLTCEATASEDVDSVQVNCTGTTQDGGQAELTGETSEFPGASITEIEGNFTGTVDGTEVLTTDRLGG